VTKDPREWPLNAAAVFAILGQPLRWAILTKAAQAQHVHLKQMAGSLGIGIELLHYHLRLLEQAGLISLSRQGGASHVTVKADAVREAAGALQLILPAEVGGPVTW
jgi:predicted transcriptional regulator